MSIHQRQKNMKKTIQFIAFLLIFSVTSTFAQKTGKASYYSSKLKGRHTSDGGRYHPDSLTCAHLTYPFGTILKVRNPKNDKEVIVKVTDRGPHTRNRMIDLSYSAAKHLDIIRAGIASVEITKLDYYPLILTLLPIPTVFLSVPSIYSVNSIINYEND